MGVYGLLAAFCYISLIHINRNNIFTRNAFLCSAVICAVYGASDEIHQYFVPNRSSELQDWIADAAGIILTLLIIRYFLKNKFKIFRKVNSIKAVT